MEEKKQNDKPLNKDFKVPKLRFKDYLDTYQNCKVKDIFQITGGGTPSTKISNFWQGNIPWISSSDLLENNIYQININHHISEEAVKHSSTKFISPKSILVVTRVGLGKVAVSEQTLCTSQDFTSLFSKNVNPYYFAYLIQKEINNEKSQGSTIKGISRNELANENIYFPSIAEQNKVYALINAVDKKICITNNKITILKKYKEGLALKILKSTIDNWKNKSIYGTKLSHFLIPYKDLSSKESYIHATLSKDGISEKTERYDRDFLVKNEGKKYRVTNKGDLIYNPANLKFGVICINRFGTCVVSPIYETFKLKNIDEDILELIVKSKPFIRYSLKFEEGTVYERRAVSVEDLLNIKICVKENDSANLIYILKTIQKKLEILNMKIKECEKLKTYLLNTMFI